MTEKKDELGRMKAEWEIQRRCDGSAIDYGLLTICLLNDCLKVGRIVQWNGLTVFWRARIIKRGTSVIRPGRLRRDSTVQRRRTVRWSDSLTVKPQ